MKIPLMQGWLRNQRYINLAMDLSSTCDIKCVECFRNFVDPPPAKISLNQIKILETQVFPYLKGLALSCTGEPLYLKNFPEGLAAAKRESRVPRATGEAGIAGLRARVPSRSVDPAVLRPLIAGKVRPSSTLEMDWTTTAGGAGTAEWQTFGASQRSPR